MEIPYFIRLLTKNDLVLSTINAKTVGDINLQDMICTELKVNSVQISDFELSCEEYFKSVSILITRYGTMIDFVSADPKYFEDSAYYFNVCNAGRLIRSAYVAGPAARFTKSKRIGNFELFAGSLQATVFKSTLYGSKITVSYKKAD